MQWGALKTAVSAWANRNDLTAQMGTFLLLAEERIYSGDPVNNIEPLRCAEMIVTASLTPVAGVLTMPAGYLELLRLRDAASRVVLTPVSEDKIGDIEGYGTGLPFRFAVRGGKIITAPGATSTSALEAVYYGKLTTPSDDADENAIMARYPSIYLHALLIEAAGYLADDEMQARALRSYVSAMAGAQAADKRAEAGGLSALAIRSDTWGQV